MDLSRLQGGGTPLIMNIATQSAATVRAGVILTMNAVTTTAYGATVTIGSTSACGAGALGVTQVSTAQASADVHNVSGPGYTRFNIDTDGIPNAAAASGGNFVPTLVNTDAMYFVSYSTSTAAQNAINIGITATTTTNVTLTSAGDHQRTGSWLMDGGNVALSSAGGTPTYNGQLRFCTLAAASDSIGLTTAMNVSTDSNLVWAGPANTKLINLNPGGDLAGSIISGTTIGKTAGNLLIVENYVSHSAAPMHPLRFWQDNGLNGLTQNVLYSEVALAGHALVKGAASA